MKKLLFLLFFILFLSTGIVLTPFSKAQDTMCNNPANLSYDDLGKCVNELSSARQQSINATTPLETEITGIQQRIAIIENDLVVKQKNIQDGYAKLTKDQQILDATIRDYYIKSYYNSPLLILLSANSASQLTQILGYQKANANRDKAIITNIALTINDLKSQKAALQDEETSISATKAKLDVIVNGAIAYQNTLANQISQLSALQQQILAQRLAGLNIPLYASTAGGCSSDIGKDPGFGSKFGFFTYGVPNRVGLNQYGAKGRADAGEKYDEILNAYYSNFQMSNLGNPNITVNGNNDYGETVNQTWDLETYLQHIYEVSASWPSEALKAQAIAARSYVMAYTNNGANSICADQHCQEVKLTGHDNPCDGWCQAVRDTAGQVMTSGGSPIKAWFSSTHGGYTHSSGDIGWSDTSYTKNAQDGSGGINNFSDLNNNAYDGPNHANSPWFYCDWGSRSGNNNTAWLQPSEVADIVNVILLAGKDSGTTSHLYQTDKGNPGGTDTWDNGRVRQELQNRGVTPFGSVSDISISADFGSGKTSSVHVSGDAGSVDINGSDFKNYFNLRAPANIQIVGPLYNVER